MTNYILSKINHDYHMFGEHYDRMQQWRLSNEYINLTINTFEDSLKCK
jgi:hypothetical protein